MIKCMTIVGTRPEFIQITPLTKALRRRHSEILVNTGQHYDDNMSNIFFRELDLPKPDISLGVGSGGHGEQTGQMMIALEPVMISEKPDWVLVYGDTNSTIAGALVAAKLHIPIAHIEAGLRSFDRQMPEEINRIITDHISDVLFPPTQIAIDHLTHEGITKGVHNVGDVRVDVIFNAVENAKTRLPELFAATHLSEGEPFVLATIHRASNTDDAARLTDIVKAFNALEMPVVLPVHPRLHKMMETFNLQFSGNVRAIDPVGYLEMVGLLTACRLVITDSGGLQKEAYMMERPCITVRENTEWIETVDSGWNRLCKPEAFESAIAQALQPPPAAHPDFYGTFGVADRMVDVLEQATTKATA